MKKFTFKGVLDGFRSSVQAAPRGNDQEIQETLRPEHFHVKKTFRHGFPFSPTALAWDPIQKLLAIGDKSGNLRILGGPGVDAHVRHDSGDVVLHAKFLVNDGGLVTATADDQLHLWTFRQKSPQRVQSLKFQRERITCLHLPLSSKWMHVGTERGNVHVVNIETFALSGYVINWNKAIEVTRPNHPGAVVEIIDNPLDASKLLIAFESGLVVVWDLRARAAEWRGHIGSGMPGDAIRAAAWHHDGKLMTAHADGALATWTVRAPRPISLSYPHAKANKDGKLEACKPIHRLEWKTSKTGETLVIFSGGLPTDKAGRTHSITVLNGKSTTVLEMEHSVVDFVTLCESPHAAEYQEPYAIVVLLQNDLVVIDLQSPGYPCFENPYPMDIHESPVTCCSYFADCPSDLIPAFYSVGRQGNKKPAGFSERLWPVDGGEWSPASCSYSEIILTGHADGSVKFWDASAGTLQILYKLKCAKVFERRAGSAGSASSMGGNEEDSPLGIQQVALCAESRRLCVALPHGHVLLFKFRKQELTAQTHVLEIPIICDATEEETSPEGEGVRGAGARDDHDTPRVRSAWGSVRVRGASGTGGSRRAAGFQATLVALQQGPPNPVAALTINSSYGLIAWGGERGVVVVDMWRRAVVAALPAHSLYLPEPSLRPDRHDRHDRRSPDLDQMNGPGGGGGGGASAGGGGGAACPTRVRRSRSQGTRKLHKCLSTASDVYAAPPAPQHSLLTTRQYCSFDKLDSSFSRSRSSSMSSLENISQEGIQCLAFADSYIKKSDPTLSVPTLWIGTTLGSVITMTINLPDADLRHTQPVIVSTSGGPIFRLKGSILTMSFLDCNGALIPYSYESWKDDTKDSRERRERTPTKQSSSGSGHGSHTSPIPQEAADRQFVVVASEKQARVVALPSQNCVYRQQIVESDFVVKAEIVSLKDSVCLVCYLSTGHLVAYSLPSLRPLLHVDFLPLSELSFQTQSKQRGIVDPMLSIWGQQLIVNEDTDQIAKTFCFSNRGHGLYLASPTEIQKFTIDTEFCQQLTEMMGELFLPRDMPEPPKESFFRGLFGGGVRPLDREELFGESSGKPNRTVAKHIPGSEGVAARASAATGEIARAHQLVVERGDKLSQLEDKTERMHTEAAAFSSSAHQLMLKYKDKKWYQL
ncbi:syntaxin-binding protein 5 isoform X7 [Pieris brassicae]|uniref:syntaxin-binding protein 5 isoform X7 n=1 Tax=Pieris brassicae TaxID=7116 RepID=UPI001E65EE2C|nr:syntaxin-binding protein 5 isoform X7 [Pieris brassicae]